VAISIRNVLDDRGSLLVVQCVKMVSFISMMLGVKPAVISSMINSARGQVIPSVGLR
jgi:hypothetical protein